jgi:hypothetical protein
MLYRYRMDYQAHIGTVDIYFCDYPPQTMFFYSLFQLASVYATFRHYENLHKD